MQLDGRRQSGNVVDRRRSSKKVYGRTVPDSFNHGTSAQRGRWLRKGLTTGDITLGDTFSQAYSQL